MPNLVIGTAGHIDHGKTALIKVLTGVDCDRLREEKERGITIVLGFASLKLPSGVEASVVDVPGHERFVRTMVAGASGIDLVLMVIAADEGVMPQTREHLDICRLLGVRRGAVALTKSDLVDDDWMGMVREDVSAFARGTFLEDAPVVACSATEGVGVEELLAALDGEAGRVRVRGERGPAFLPIDRVFSMKGFGTVVTGTLVSGKLQGGDQVDLLPGPRGVRLRGLQVHGGAVTEVSAGSRVAANLQGVEVREVSRGAALVRAGTLDPTAAVDCRMQLLSQARPLKDRSRILFHTGTTQTLAAIQLLEGARVEPGQDCWVRFHLSRPLATLPGEHFILRGFVALDNYGNTVGGGEIINPWPAGRRLGPAGPRRKSAPPVALRRGSVARVGPMVVEGLKILAGGSLEERIARHVLEAGRLGLAAGELPVRVRADAGEVEKVVSSLMSRRLLHRFDQERRMLVHDETLHHLQERARDELSRYHGENPLKEGLAREELRRRLASDLDPRLFHLVVRGLEEKGEVVASQQVVRLAGHGVSLGGKLDEAKEDLARIYRRAALTPPRSDEVARRIGLSLDETTDLLNLLCKEGKLTRVKDDLYFDARAADALRERLVAHLEERGEITTQEFKEMVGATRKWTIPLSEYFDREKVTLRVGEVRRLRKE